MTGSLSKEILLLEPGKHRLASFQVLTNMHFLDVDVEAGKRYYVLVRFIYGVGFQLRPIRLSGTSDYRMDGPDYPKWQSTTRYVEKAPGGDDYFAIPKLVKRGDKAYAKAVIEWQKKTDVERAELTLTPADAAPL